MQRKSAQEKSAPAKGRRPGNANTREEILAAARRLFAEQGFYGASLRSIAKEANVDVALISHFFGSKDDLFLETIHVPANIFQPLFDAFDGPADGFGERFVRAYLKIWVSPGGGSRLLSTVRSSFPHQPLSAALFEHPQAGLLDNFAAQVVGPDAKEARSRAELAFAILFGVLLGRHVIRSPALAESDPSALAAMLAPTLQHLLMPDAKGRSPEKTARTAQTKSGRGQRTKPLSRRLLAQTDA